MKKRSKSKSSAGAPQDKLGIAVLLDKVQQQLSAMEKKLDTLISQPPKRSFEKNYSQNPPRPFNYSQRHDRGRQGNGSRERTYTRVVCSECRKECEIPFKPSGDRPVYCKECFSKRRQGSPFNANRDNRPTERSFTKEHHPNKRQAMAGVKREKPGKKKKPFYAGRKKRG